MNKDLVSILIPTYDRPSYLRIALASAFNQTYKNIEVIVVDDSPNDLSENICNEYGTKIKYYHRQEKGITSAYNFGIKKMQGMWYKVMSDDNILEPNCIQTMLNYVKDPEKCILYSDYEIINIDGKILGLKKARNFLSHYNLAKAIWKTSPMKNETNLIHKTCFNIVGEYDETFGSAFDYEWLLRACLLKKCNFIYVPHALMKVRLHSEMVSSTNYSDKVLLLQKRQRIEKIHEKIKKQLIYENPEEWEKLKLNKKSSKMNNPLRMFREIIPFDIRIRFRRFWYKKIKSFSEIPCEVCKISHRKSFVYFKPYQESIFCKNCQTYFKPSKKN